MTFLANLLLQSTVYLETRYQWWRIPLACISEGHGFGQTLKGREGLVKRCYIQILQF